LCYFVVVVSHRFGLLRYILRQLGLGKDKITRKAILIAAATSVCAMVINQMHLLY
jgi:hypothetical protein